MSPRWSALVAAEPRLAALLEAATELVGRNDDCHAEAVYVVTKPLLAWLVGDERGRPPRPGARTAPPATRLWAMAKVVRPFTPAPSWLDTRTAYDEACAHINEHLHQVQRHQEAA